MENRELLFYVLSGLLLMIFFLQVAGYMDEINTRVDSTLPHTSSFPIVLLTETAGMAAFLIVVLFFAALDVRKTGHLSYPTVRLVLSGIITLGIVAILKSTFQTPRPNEAEVSLPFLMALKNVDYFAFPSGHTARASVLASYLQERSPRYAPLWWAYAVGIALTRLLLHVHWLGDVLFSLLLGSWAYLLVDLTRDSWLPVYQKTVKLLGLEVFDVELVR